MFYKTAATDAYWRAFANAAGLDHSNYVVARFGDDASMADSLLALTLAGTKRATASLLREYGPCGDPLPRVGDYVVVVDGRGVPGCIWQTTDVVVKPLCDVDAQFAWDEGEGDRTLAWWRDAHRDYFTRQASRERFTMHERIDTVFERFVVVWPITPVRET